LVWFKVNILWILKLTTQKWFCCTLVVARGDTTGTYTYKYTTTLHRKKVGCLIIFTDFWGRRETRDACLSFYRRQSHIFVRLLLKQCVLYYWVDKVSFLFKVFYTLIRIISNNEMIHKQHYIKISKLRTTLVTVKK